MFEQTECSKLELSSAPSQEPSRDTPLGTDYQLFRLCNECRSAHAQWVACFDSFPDDVVDQAPASAELARLRSVWRIALDRLQELPPTTLPGALAKHDLACTLKGWSGDDDVFEFLSLTSREMSAVLCSSLIAVKPLYETKGPRKSAGRVARVGL